MDLDDVSLVTMMTTQMPPPAFGLKEVVGHPHTRHDNKRDAHHTKQESGLSRR